MKKITTLVLSLVLVLAMSITAFAATPNDEVKAALTEAGVTGEYYDQAVKFLANNELTAEQATAVKNEIKAAKATAGGKFLGQQVSAVGFSIGFERIFSILMEHGVDLADKGNKIAVMYDDGDLTNAYRIAEKYRAEGKICSLYVKPKKMGKFLSKLQERGYAGFINVSNGDEISDFE